MKESKKRSPFGQLSWQALLKQTRRRQEVQVLKVLTLVGATKMPTCYFPSSRKQHSKDSISCPARVSMWVCTWKNACPGLVRLSIHFPCGSDRCPWSLFLFLCEQAQPAFNPHSHQAEWSTLALRFLMLPIRQHELAAGRMRTRMVFAELGHFLITEFGCAIAFMIRVLRQCLDLSLLFLNPP